VSLYDKDTPRTRWILYSLKLGCLLKKRAYTRAQSPQQSATTGPCTHQPLPSSSNPSKQAKGDPCIPSIDPSKSIHILIIVATSPSPHTRNCEGWLVSFVGTQGTTQPPLDHDDKRDKVTSRPSKAKPIHLGRPNHLLPYSFKEPCRATIIRRRPCIRVSLNCAHNFFLANKQVYIDISIDR
jgi:hypothetical protein